MLPYILNDAEVQLAKLRRELVDDFVQAFQRTQSREPNDVEIRVRMECMGYAKCRGVHDSKPKPN